MNYVKCSFSTITENEKFPTNKRKKNSNPCTEKKKGNKLKYLRGLMLNLAGSNKYLQRTKIMNKRLQECITAMNL